MKKNISFEENIPLGKEAEYQFNYDASLLFPIARQQGRELLNINADLLPFTGSDRWTAYELSWLSTRGVPQVGIAEFDFSCLGKNIIESKSFKLYLNSFNQTQVTDKFELIKIMQADLSAACEGKVEVSIFSVNDYPIIEADEFICIDDLDMDCEIYEPNADILELDSSSANLGQKIKSHLLRSLCPVTGQPDWATIYIDYQGPPITTSSLLSYIVSFRNHQGFHEQCVEQIFNDLSIRFQPSHLAVYARYMRRGGLDINPLRHTLNYEKKALELIKLRTARQ